MTPVQLRAHIKQFTYPVLLVQVTSEDLRIGYAIHSWKDYSLVYINDTYLNDNLFKQFMKVRNEEVQFDSEELDDDYQCLKNSLKNSIKRIESLDFKEIQNGVYLSPEYRIFKHVKKENLWKVCRRVENGYSLSEKYSECVLKQC